MDIRGDSSYELSRQREGGPWHGQRERPVCLVPSCLRFLIWMNWLPLPPACRISLMFTGARPPTASPDGGLTKTSGSAHSAAERASGVSGIWSMSAWIISSKKPEREGRMGTAEAFYTKSINSNEIRHTRARAAGCQHLCAAFLDQP